MKMSQKELVDLLESVGIDFSLNNETPGMFDKTGKRLKFSEISLPSKYYGTISNYNPNLILKVSNKESVKKQASKYNMDFKQNLPRFVNIDSTNNWELCAS